jgi:hypothetical protein
MKRDLLSRRRRKHELVPTIRGLTNRMAAVERRSVKHTKDIQNIAETGEITTVVRSSSTTTITTSGGGSSGDVIYTSQVEVDLGSTLKSKGSVVITDANIVAGSKIIIQQAPGPYTGKGTRADEAEMDPIWVSVEAGAGTATAAWMTLGFLTSHPERPGQNFRESQAFRMPRKLGRVRGYMKFWYMVLP